MAHYFVDGGLIFLVGICGCIESYGHVITEAQLDWVVINVYQQTNTCLFPVIVFLLNFMFIRFNVIDFIQQQ